jgi:hypothetical protein
MSDPIDDAFNSLHQGNLLSAKDARIRQLEESLEAMREAGDALWYCFRHAQTVEPEQLLDAVRDWQEARNRA